MASNKNIRTRFSPSPTGYLHLGGARTALLNYLYAKNSGGAFVLRIEDTDLSRSDIRYERAIIEDLQFLGIEADEGPHIPPMPHMKGPKGRDLGPYRQSERGEIYDSYVKRLLEGGAAYRCYCTKERLAALSKEQAEKHLPPRYDGRCSEIVSNKAGGNKTGGGEAEERDHVIRLRTGSDPLSYDDTVKGDIEFDLSEMGDFIIVQSSGKATFLLASALDDALMSITDVIRGDDHISNTPRQLLILAALGLTPPRYGHIPLITDLGGTPLSKRTGGGTVRGLREGGYTREGIINTIARLGWGLPDDGLLSLGDLTERFNAKEVKGLSRSPSKFSDESLNRYQHLATSAMTAEEIIDNNRGILGEEGVTLGGVTDKELCSIIDAVKGNGTTTLDVNELAGPFTGEISYSEDNEALLRLDESKAVLKAFRKAVDGGDEGDRSPNLLNEAGYKDIIKVVKKETGSGGKGLFMPLRIALTAKKKGIELHKVVSLLGRERVLERLNRAIGL